MLGKLALGIVALVTLVTAARIAGGQPACMTGWQPGYTGRKVYGDIQCFHRLDPDGDGPRADELIMGGFIGSVPTQRVQNIAAWDGVTWRGFGDGLNGAVCALATHNQQLVAGGLFTASGSTVLNGVARWDGAAWQALGSGLTSGSSAVHSIASFDGQLYACGNFPGRFRRWSGTTWEAVPGWTSSDIPTRLATFAGQLVIMGTFTRSGVGIALWNGTSLSTMPGLVGSNTNGPWTMTELNGSLYFAWPRTSNSNADRIYRWDGAALHVLPDVTSNTPRRLDLLTSVQGRLLALGEFQQMSAATFDGNTWSRFGPATRFWLGAFVQCGIEFGDHLFVGNSSYVQVVEPTPPFGRTLWFPGEGWGELDHNLVSHRGRVVIDGAFQRQDGSVSAYFPSWNGHSFDGLVNAPVYTEEDNRVLWSDGDDLIVLLPLYTGSSTATFGRLSGGQWHFETIDAPFTFRWRAWSRWNSEQVVAGYWTDYSTTPSTTRGKVFAKAVDGWRQLGPDFLGKPESLAATSAGLFVAGDFTGTSGGPVAAGIAQWDGQAWQPVAEGLPSAPIAMRSFNDELIVAGTFAELSGLAVNGVAAWNGQLWRPLGAGSPGAATGLPAIPDELWITYGLSPGGGIARWNGTEWVQFVHAADGPIHAAVRHGNEIVATGGFVRPGGPSGPLAAGWARFALSDQPLITDDPGRIEVCPSRAATLRISHSGPGPMTYQWTRNGVALADGGHPDGLGVTGASTPVLRLTGLPIDQPGAFACTVSNACGSDTSAPAILSLCLADFNCSQTVSVQDILDFLAMYFAGNAAADFNLSGDVSIQDIFDYLAAYFAGC